MKRANHMIAGLFLLSIFASNSIAKIEDFTLKLNDQIVIFDGGLGSLSADTLGNISGIININEGISIGLINEIKAIGITTFKYAGGKAFFIYGKQSDIDKVTTLLTQNSKTYSFADIKPEYKISQDILDGKIEEWSKDENGRYILDISLLANISKEDLTSLLPNAEIVYVNEHFKSAQVKIPFEYLNELISLAIVQSISAISPPMSIPDPIPVDENELAATNNSSADMLGMYNIWGGPYYLRGNGIKVGVVDMGDIRATHQEFMSNGHSRVTVFDYGDENSLSDHATHVAGTIGAKGVEGIAHGMANEVSMYGYYVNDTRAGVSISRANSLYTLRFLNKVYLSNHSYGPDIWDYTYEQKNDYMDDYGGIYNHNSQNVDEEILNYPKTLMFISAGNYRDRVVQNYQTLLDYKLAKNAFTIGSIDENLNISSFSDVGPVSNGRIKPDFVTKGEDIYSSIASGDSDYKFKDGTSMATPAATGAAALIKEFYKKQTNMDITADTMKAILANTAQDLGRPGPDYEYGFGLIQADKAVDLIANMNSGGRYGSYIKNGLMVHYTQKDFKLKPMESYSTNFRATVSWLDQGSSFLGNDIDLFLLNKYGDVVKKAYCLQASSPESNAAECSSLNYVDNTEQIEDVITYNEGPYTLRVKMYVFSGKPSNFTLVSNLPFENSSKDDFNSDGTSDLLFYNGSINQYMTYQLNPEGKRDGYKINNAPAGWNIEATGNFNDDGVTDILWRNYSTGTYMIYVMNSDGTRRNYKIGYNLPLDWYVVDVGYFNDDQFSDILWFNNKTHQYMIYTMDFDKPYGRIDWKIGYQAPQGWYPISTGDFNKDGKSDILWFNYSTRQYMIYTMNFDNSYGRIDWKMGYTLPEGWYPVNRAVGDFNNDGYDDILLRNWNTNQYMIYFMNFNQTKGRLEGDSGFKIGYKMPDNWYPIKVTDFNNDGTADILWWNYSSSTYMIYIMGEGGNRAFYEIGYQLPNYWNLQ